MTLASSETEEGEAIVGGFVLVSRLLDQVLHDLQVALALASCNNERSGTVSRPRTFCHSFHRSDPRDLGDHLSIVS